MKGRVIANVRGWFSGRHRVWLLTIPGVAALVLLLMAVVPFLLDANAFRPLIERQMSTSLNRPVQLGNLSFSLFTASLVADNVVIGDNPRTATPFLQANALHIGVEAWPLLLQRQIVITRFVADQPRIHLVHLQNGTWNFSSLSQSLLGATSNRNNTGGSKAGISAKILAAPSLASAKVQIRNGTVTVEGMPGMDRPLVYQNVEVTARHVAAAGRFPFQVSASLPAGGRFSVDGTAGPLAPSDIADTPFSASLTISNLNPAGAGMVEPGKGVAFVADITARAISDGRSFRTTGTIRAGHLQLAKNGAPSAEPIDATFDIAAALTTHSTSPNGTELQIRDLAIKTGSSAAHVSGTVTLLPAQALLNARLSAERLPIDELQTLLPSVGVRLPRGAALQGGTATANLVITGPASAAEFSGPIDVENTNLSGFNLGSKLNGLATLSGIVSGDSTAIQSLRTDVVVRPNGVSAQNLYAALPAIGTANGSGTISPYGVLDFHLMVKLSSRAGAGGNAFGIVSTLGGLLGHTAPSPLADGIPISITGTQEDPRIRVSLPLVGTAANVEHDGDRGLHYVHAGQLLQGLLGH